MGSAVQLPAAASVVSIAVGACFERAAARISDSDGSDSGGSVAGSSDKIDSLAEYCSVIASMTSAASAIHAYLQVHFSSEIRIYSFICNNQFP